MAERSVPPPFPVRQGSGAFPPLQAASVAVAKTLLEAGWVPTPWAQVFPKDDGEAAHSAGARAYRQRGVTLSYDPRRAYNKWVLAVDEVHGRSWSHLMQLQPWGLNVPSVGALLRLPAATWDYADDEDLANRFRLAGYEQMPHHVEGITKWRGSLPGTAVLMEITRDRPTGDPRCPHQGYWDLSAVLLDKRTLEAKAYPLVENVAGLGEFLAKPYSGRVGDVVITDATVGVMLGVI